MKPTETILVVLYAGCEISVCAGAGAANRGVSGLMLREMEDMRNLSIGSPVPTPRNDYDDDDDDSVFARAFDDSSFPAIKIDRSAAVFALDRRYDMHESA